MGRRSKHFKTTGCEGFPVVLTMVIYRGMVGIDQIFLGREAPPTVKVDVGHEAIWRGVNKYSPQCVRCRVWQALFAGSDRNKFSHVDMLIYI